MAGAPAAEEEFVLASYTLGQDLVGPWPFASRRFGSDYLAAKAAFDAGKSPPHEEHMLYKLERRGARWQLERLEIKTVKFRDGTLKGLPLQSASFPEVGCRQSI